MTGVEEFGQRRAGSPSLLFLLSFWGYHCSPTLSQHHTEIKFSSPLLHFLTDEGLLQFWKFRFSDLGERKAPEPRLTTRSRAAGSQLPDVQHVPPPAFLWGYFAVWGFQDSSRDQRKKSATTESERGNGQGPTSRVKRHDSSLDLWLAV